MKDIDYGIDKYTVSIKTLTERQQINIFDFDYTLEVIDKQELEKRFINKYFFREIGYETYDMWKYKFKQRWLDRVKVYNIFFNEYKNIDPRLSYKRTIDELITGNLSANEIANSNIFATSSGTNINKEQNTPISAFENDDYLSFKGEGNSSGENEQTSQGQISKTNEEEKRNNTTIKEMNENELKLLNDFIKKYIDIIERFLNEFADMFIQIF